MSHIIKVLKKLKRYCKKLFQKKYHAKYIYAWYYKHGKVRENQVLFESFHGRTISDSPFYMLKELMKRGNFDIYYSTSDYKAHKDFIKKNHLNVKLVKINSRRYQKAMATCKYLINNSSFPSYFIKKDQQIYMQTWHGTPLKTLGKNMKRGIESMYNVQHNFLQADYLMFPNEFTKDAMMTDYNLTELYTGKVILCGYPRNSIFLDQEKARQVRKKLNLEEKTVYAYMPTWRGKNNKDIATTSYEEDVKKILDVLDKQLKDNQILYVNLHPIVRQNVSISTYQHIFPFPSNVDNYEFLNSVDALITDYSSVFFDFSITRKPIILFMYDFEQYMADRGTYFDAKSLPFTKVYELEELAKLLVSEEVIHSKTASDDYYEKFAPYDSLDASKILMDIVLGEERADIKIEDYSFNRERYRKILYPNGIQTRETLEELAQKAAEEESVVVLERKWFNDELNQWMYEEYNDKFTYIVIYRNIVNTYIELFARKMKIQKVIKELRIRGIKRCLPNLKVDPDYPKQM